MKKIYVFLWIYIANVSVDTLIEMNLELVNEMIEKKISNDNLTPIFVLSDKNSIEIIEPTEKNEEVHSHAHYK